MSDPTIDGPTTTLALKSFNGLILVIDYIVSSHQNQIKKETFSSFDYIDNR